MMRWDDLYFSEQLWRVAVTLPFYREKGLNEEGVTSPRSQIFR